MQGGLIEQEKKRLLRKGARQNDALFFAAGDLVHPAVAEMVGTDLGKSIVRDEHVVFGFEAQRAAVGMASLQNKFPGARREKQGAFLLDHGDALGAGLGAEANA